MPWYVQLKVGRLLPANFLHHISKRTLGGKCHSFSVGFSFQEEAVPLAAKILRDQAVRISGVRSRQFYDLLSGSNRAR